MADFLKSKKELVILLSDSNFPRSNKILRPLIYSILTIKSIWLHNNYLFVYPLRDSHLYSLSILFVKMLRSTKVVGYVHHLYSLHHYTHWLKRFISRIFEKFAIDLSDVLIVISQSTKSDVLKFNSSKKVFVVYPGTDLKHVRRHVKYTVSIKQKTHKKLLYTGTISRRKGLAYLLAALNQLQEKNIKLEIVGDTNYERSYYEKLCFYIAEHDLKEAITFCGRLSHGELDRKFRDADIFVLPSLWEGYGIVLIEAMKYGLPIIASNVGAISEIVTDNVNGLLVPPANPTLLAQALQRLLSDVSLQERMCCKNLEKAKKIPGWEQVAKTFYETLLQIGKMD